MPKKIPILLAFFILFFAIGAASLLIQNLSSKHTGNSSKLEPQNLLVANISDTSCKILWQTATPATGVVNLTSKNDTKITAQDERDSEGTLRAYSTHSISVKNLEPSTIYTFEVISNGKRFSGKDAPYTFQTGPTITDTTVAGFEPSYGTVKTYDGKPATGGVIVVSLEGSQPIATLITNSGSWIIPLNFIRTKDLSRYLPASKNITEFITVYYDSEKTESITDTENDSPVPDMIVGNSYDFRNKEANTNKATSLSDMSSQDQESVLGVQAPTSLPSPTGTQRIGGVSITSPTQNASLVSTRPMISGTGIAGKTVSLTIGINKPTNGKTTVGSNGLWSFTPEKPLSVGKQSVTITTVDEKENPIALTTLFTVLKSGSQVLGDATPSATLEPTPEASMTAEPMPEPGTTLPTILLIVVGVGMIAGGVVLLH